MQAVYQKGVHQNASPNVDVSIAADSDQTAWTAYLSQRRIEHHAYNWAWRTILRSVFGHQPYYFIARSTDGTKEILGILPCVLMKSLLFGRSLVSLPYLNAGGVVGTTPEIERALVEFAVELGKDLRVDYLELRQRQSAEHLLPGMQCRSHKVSMQLRLEPDPEKLFAHFAPKLRSQVRRPSKSGMYAVISGESKSAYESLQAFYHVFSEHMRDLGTPVYPRRLFEEVLAHFGDRCRIITVWQEQLPVAAGITLGQGSSVEIPWAASLKRFSRHSPNMLLYWEAMKRACLDGYSTFDFGRSSPDSGPFRFKQQWQPTPVPLHWYYSMHRPGSLPDVNPSSPKYALLVRCWQRLPLPLANSLGPWLTRGIP